MLPAIQVSNLALHPGVFFSPAYIKSVHGLCDSPTFLFPKPSSFSLSTPVDSKVLITVSSTLAVYLVWSASSQSFLPICLLLYSNVDASANFWVLFSLSNLPVASLARLMSKLFSRPQSSLWHNQLVMKQTYCLLKGPCVCLVMSDPLPPHRL